MAVITIDEKIFANGVKQKDLVALLTALGTNLTLVATTLNADLGVTDIDYAGVTLDATKVNANGIISQGSVLDYLNGWIAALAVMTAKLDTDTLQKSDYAAKFDVTDTISADAAGDGATYMGDIGVNQGTLIGFIKTCVTNLNALNVYLDADTTVATATYASSCNVTDMVDLN